VRLDANWRLAHRKLEEKIRSQDLADNIRKEGEELENHCTKCAVVWGNGENTPTGFIASGINRYGSSKTEIAHNVTSQKTAHRLRL
jgi:hypothetical protein